MRLVFCNMFTCCDPLECLCCGLPNDVHQNFIERFGMCFLFHCQPFTQHRFSLPPQPHSTLLLSFIYIYIYNKSFAFIVYVQINIYYLIMLSCVWPIRLGWSILARFITNCGSLFYFIFLILQNILCFFFFFWGKVGLKIIFWGWLSFDRHNMKFRCCHVIILRTAIIGLESLSKIF